MMNTAKIEEAAGNLWSAWQSGQPMDGLPAELRPRSPEEGYMVQQAVAKLSGRGQLGWKLAATNESAQSFLGVDGPLSGRLFEGNCLDSGATVSLEKINMRAVEVEIAFRIERSLPPRDSEYSIDEVLSAVGSLYPALEIPDSRYTEYTAVGAAQLIADNACACLFVLGPEVAVAKWRDADLPSHAVSALLNGELAAEGVGSNIFGDPRLALVWLANDLSSRGDTLAEGQVVMTGTVVNPLPIKPGDHVVGDFGSFGTVEAVLS